MQVAHRQRAAVRFPQVLSPNLPNDFAAADEGHVRLFCQTYGFPEGVGAVLCRLELE